MKVDKLELDFIRFFPMVVETATLGACRLTSARLTFGLFGAQSARYTRRMADNAERLSESLAPLKPQALNLQNVKYQSDWAGKPNNENQLPWV